MLDFEIDVQGEFARLREAFEAFEALREEGEPALRTRVGEVSGWSVEQHLYHVALATDLAFRHVRALVAGKGRLIRAEGELGARAAEVLANDATPRGEAVAPRMVTPDEEVNPEFLAMELRGNREGLAALEELSENIPSAAGWIPHQDLGPLSAPHWLRFSALHARHHWAIVRDIRAAATPQT
ncbi:MAG: DinB family protein [Planctomycetota bacterium]